MRKFLQKQLYLFSFLIFALISSADLNGQTVLIDPAQGGGFELGSTLADNGWTAVNATTDGWVVGSAPVVATGTNCGFISNNGGASWAYSQNSTFTHLIKEFTVPVGESKLTLTFKWKANGEGTGTTDWDNMKIFLAPTSKPIQTVRFYSSPSCQFQWHRLP